MVSRMEKKPKGETDLVVFSHGGFSSPKEVNPRTSESKYVYFFLFHLSDGR